MSVEMYEPCPCGSGKKLKFCCGSVHADMQKINRQLENDQVVMAIQGLERLVQSHPDVAWGRITLASILLDEGREDEAGEHISALLERDAKHPVGLCLRAVYSLVTRGYQASRMIIADAFSRSLQACPDLLAMLAMRLSQLMMANGNLMGARHYLALALRFCNKEMREKFFMRLVELESDRDIPYPLRSVHPLVPVSEPEELVAPVSQAIRLAQAGCIGPAVVLLEAEAEAHPENAAVWQNLGFCRAWDANLEGAVEALRRAAQLDSDFPRAVELETIAQLLELETAQVVDRVTMSLFEIESASRLLSQLDQCDRVFRQPVVRPDLVVGGSIVATYSVLDRQRKPVTDETPFEEFPQSIAVVIVAARDSNDPESRDKVVVQGYEGPELNAAVQILHEAAGGQLEPVIPDDGDERVVGFVAPETRILQVRVAMIEELSHKRRESIWREFAQRAVEVDWPNTPLLGLGGKTPREAAADPEMKLPLTAAVYTLDAHCDMRQLVFDPDAVFRDLHIEPLPPLEVTDETPLQTLSSIQLHRIDVSQLSDKQLSSTLQRAMLTHHDRFLRRIAQEALSRPTYGDPEDRALLCQLLVDIAARYGESRESLKWLHEMQANIRKQPDHFQNLLEAEMRELQIRVINPDELELEPFLRRLVAYYSPKIEGFTRFLEPLLQDAGLPLSLLDVSEDPLNPSGTLTEGGIWTPEAAAGSGEGKKLWLPGQ